MVNKTVLEGWIHWSNWNSLIKTTTARVQIQISCVETDDNNDDNDNNSNNAIDEDVNDHNNLKKIIYMYINIYIYAYGFFEEAVFNFRGCSIIAHF